MKTFNYKNAKIAFTDSGSGDTIILLHGYLENRLMWQFCIPEMVKNKRIIAIDLLGHGDSDCLGYIHTIEDQAEMVFGVLTHLQINNVSIVGHSMGGYIALAFAELYPQHLQGLVLMNSTSLEDSLERKKNRDRAIAMVKKDYNAFVRLSIANLFSPENRLLLVDQIENVKTAALKTPLQGIVAALEGMKIRKNRQSVFRHLKIPKLLILSKKDPVLDYLENLKQIKNSDIQLATLADGHMSHIENRTELLQIIINFVS